MTKRIVLFLGVITSSFSAICQIDGDKIFQNDQIITIELTFHQASFFDSLETNYLTQEYMKADLVLTDSTGTYSYPEVGVRLKGNSTYNHPNNKKAFKIDFNKYVSGQKHDGLKKLNFSNGFKDPSMMREKVFFEVSKAVGVQVPRANFANVYFNGNLWGFYTVVEQIDDQFLDWSILDDAGNLFKAGENFGTSNPPANLIYYGSTIADYTDRYELKTNETANDWSDIISFMDFVNNSSSTDFENDLTQKIELTEYLRSVALDNMFSNLDSYTGSARNYYVYHHSVTDKWEWIKWDGNESFGSYSGGGGPGGVNVLNLDPDYHDSERPLLENVFASPSLYNLYLIEYCHILENYFNSTYMDALIDSYTSLIHTAVYADYNKMYTDADFDTNVNADVSTSGGPGGGTIYGLKSFVSSRASYLDGVVDCSVYTSVEKIKEFGSIRVFPNPATNQIKLNWEVIHNVEITILNSLGVTLYVKSIDSNNSTMIDVSSWANGMYYVRLTSEDGTSNTRIFSVIK